MLLVGQGSVGKTSLVKRLLWDEFNLHEEKTEGIEIEEWQVAVDDQKIRLNVWDFGGQEIMHATHQFFLTKRSLYLLVLDARLGDEENRIEYWLKIIKSFGADSPVIIVGNKIDEQPLDVDKRGLMAKYRNIRDIVGVSCKEGKGIDELKDVIAGEVGSLDHIHDPVAVGNDIAQQENGMKGVEPAHRPTLSPPPGTEHANPWISGSFYLVAAVVIMAVIAVIIKNIPWYAIPVVIIGGVIFIAVIGALQLRQDKRLSEDSFLTLVRETFKQLPLLKK